jgi:transcription initiation factor IIE alpha subunit
MGPVGGGGVADSAFLTRLRTGDGPSHLLLVLLDQHRVMTTGQLARATDTPERTVRFRLDRLHEAGLVAYARPGRERGSAPRHWWLRPTGARLVAGTAAAEGKPSAMFAAHAAAISEVWLATREHGPAQGIELNCWLTDRAGWQEWDAGRYWSRRYRLTPDAVARVTMPDRSPAVAFIEVDLASMTQTLLKEKVARYLSYAADRAWQGIHPYCPPLLLLTTTATRAATFVRAAGQLIDQHERTYPLDDPADVLVVAACGHVHDPVRAITEACWKVPEAAAAELTLGELLSERLEAQAESEDWYAHHDVAARRRADIEVLQDLRSFTALADWLDSEPAAEALRLIIGTAPATFLDTEPDLAGQVIGWGRNRRRVHRSEAREHARAFIAVLEARHTALWAQQARLLLSSHEHLAAPEPGLCRLIATVAAGHLAENAEIDTLHAAPPRARQQLQHDAYGDYPARRDGAIEAHWAALSRRARRQTSREQLAATHDNEHLIICATCEIIYLKLGPNALLQDRCPHCEGALLDWAARDSMRPLTRRLDDIRRRLSEATMHRDQVLIASAGVDISIPPNEGATQWHDPRLHP